MRDDEASERRKVDLRLIIESKLWQRLQPSLEAILITLQVDLI